MNPTTEPRPASPLPVAWPSATPGSVAIVGAGDDIGAAITRRFAAGGYTVLAASLDAAALIATAEEPAVKARQPDNTQQSHARGAFGSPTCLVGQEIFFGKDRLRDVDEHLLGQAPPLTP